MSTQEPLPLADSYECLTLIGLSALSARCYQIIYQQGFITATEIAQLLNKPYRSIYRSIHALQQKGFVKHVYTGRHPHKYEAVLLEEALETYADWQRAQVHKLLKVQQRRYHEQALRRL